MKRIDPSIIAEVSRMLGAKGGHAAAKAMTKKERTERARKAGKASAVVRWGTGKKERGGK